MYNLERFRDAQERTYEAALAELKAGRKRTHWMWFIFPQLRSLGYSDRSQYFGIEDADEARAYLDDPVLGARLITCARAILEHGDKEAVDIMGEVDAQKLRSSATLFHLAGGGAVFQHVLAVFFDGQPCERTEAELRQSR